MTRSAAARCVAAVFILMVTADARAQGSQDRAPDDAFAARQWHVEFALQTAFEAWNYNGSHEELYGLLEGVTYGLREGLVLTARQHAYYVSQRRNDTWVVGLTAGLRARVYRRGRTSAFVQFDIGISDAAIATPPRGTRFNYLVLGGGGALVRLSRHLHLMTTLELIHVSNASLKGPDRNPDIEAVGPTVGLLVSF